MNTGTKVAIGVGVISLTVLGIYLLTKKAVAGNISLMVHVFSGADNVTPIPGASVTLGSVTQIANPQGMMEFTGLTEQIYNVTCSATGYLTSFSKVPVTAQTGAYAIYLQPGTAKFIIGDVIYNPPDTADTYTVIGIAIQNSVLYYNLQNNQGGLSLVLPVTTVDSSWLKV